MRHSSYLLACALLAVPGCAEDPVVAPPVAIALQVVSGNSQSGTPGYRIGAEGATCEARDALEGISGVLEGRWPSYSLEYPCHTPNRQHWFSMSVTPLWEASWGVVITKNIAQRKHKVGLLFKLIL